MSTTAGGDLGAHLRQLRLAAGLSQESLAHQAGVSPKTVRAIERGAANHRPATLGRLMEALGLDIDQRAALFGSTGVTQSPAGQSAEARPGPLPLAGPALRAARQRQGWTQRELAHRAGVHFRTVSDLERGAADRAHPATALRLARALDLNGRPMQAFIANLAGGHGPMGLTAEIDGLVGRHRELVDISDALATSRVVRLVGPGGVGKTALATAVANTYSSAHVARLGIYEPGTRLQHALCEEQSVDLDALDALVRSLNGADLLVLDNLEHLSQVADDLDVLAAALNCPILVTTRRRADHPGHREIPIQPLDAQAATELLLLRVQDDHRIGGWADPTEVHQAICRRLDNLPLAIELTAQWSRMLAPEDLLRRLNSEAPPGRHHPAGLPVDRAMRAAVLRSAGLLSPPAATLFRELALHAASWTVDYAEAVHGGQAAFLPLLDELIELGLVVVDHNEEGVRLRLLSVVREVAGEEPPAAHRLQELLTRRATWCRALAADAAEGLVGDRQQHWLARLDAEREHLYATIDQLTESDPVAAVELAGALWRYWNMRGQYRTGVQWLSTALDTVGGIGTDQALATAHYGRAVLRYLAGDVDGAMSDARLALEASTAIGDGHGLGSCCSLLGMIDQYRSDHPGAERWYQHGLRSVSAVVNQRAQATLLANYGSLLTATGRPAEAAVLIEEAMAHFEQLGDQRAVADMGSSLAMLAIIQGDPERARSLAGTSRQGFARLGDPQGVLDCMLLQIQVDLDLGRLSPAAAGIADARAVLAGHEDPWGSALLGAYEAEADLQRGDVDQAFRRARQSLRAADRLGYGRAQVRAGLVEALVWFRRNLAGSAFRAAGWTIERCDLECPQQLVLATLVLARTAEENAPGHHPPDGLEAQAIAALNRVPGAKSVLLGWLTQTRNTAPGFADPASLLALRERALALVATGSSSPFGM